METSYDYIIAGAGAAGLMLAAEMNRDPFFANKKIMLIDQDTKQSNDRTWCFWEELELANKHADIVFHTWKNILVKDAKQNIQLDLSPMKYQMVRGKEFYEMMLAEIRKSENIKMVVEKVTNIIQKSSGAEVVCNLQSYMAKHVFTSIFDISKVIPNHGFPYLNQHFIGWFIKTDVDIFDPTTATFMDFSVPQNGNTRFMYVLPFSKTEALIEYTLFSKDLLSDIEYTNAIEKYIAEQGIKNYTITETERGVIPMTTYPFDISNTQNITYIGTAGGWTKACTGYTFYNNTKYIPQLSTAIKKGKFTVNLKGRHRWYDHVMLSVLQNNNHLGSSLFTNMFLRNDVRTILKFLDGSTNLMEEISIMIKTKPLFLFTLEAIKTLPHFLFKKLKS